jgi:hypothetical protein
MDVDVDLWRISMDFPEMVGKHGETIPEWSKD